jgi:hypothetical protein
MTADGFFPGGIVHEGALLAGRRRRYFFPQGGNLGHQPRQIYLRNGRSTIRHAAMLVHWATVPENRSEIVNKYRV